ncbi:hypothetical protein PQO03_13390 [Lentisphaera profundi]|uniref:Uncharacterized protein n=1 Tax=Lentisphaera profundi TaxID=1658616 RepID=A0ABY7VZZ6_9BACT|nr:hypothetical protein [Lentisphaera profundi]WDE98828.1 hypothetical protein PQO03_13390 [Lentisphaera profundi]
MTRLTKLHIETIAQPDVLTDTILTPNIEKLTQAFQDLRDNINFLVHQIAMCQYGQELKFISYLPKENKYIERNLEQERCNRSGFAATAPHSSELTLVNSILGQL